MGVIRKKSQKCFCDVCSADITSTVSAITPSLHALAHRNALCHLKAD